MKFTYPLLAGAVFLAALLTGCQTSQVKMPSVKSSADSLHTIPATHAAIATMGRTELDGDVQRFGFPGVSFFVNAKGTELRAIISSTSANSWLDVIVDDAAPILIPVPQTPTSVVLFNEPTEAIRQVRITHRTENWQGQVTLHGLKLKGSGFLEAPSLPKRRLLVLGDSVTCGEALDRDENAEKTSRWWNARESYGLLAADLVNAQAQLVCWGGRGLIRSWNGITTDANLPEFSHFTRGDRGDAAAWDSRRYQPHVIVSAIGTNDFSKGIPDRSEYVTAYKAFVETLLNDYPNAQIILIEGSILNGAAKSTLVDYIGEVVSLINNPRVHQGSSPHYPGSPVDSHPTKEQHKLMAEHLAKQLAPLFD